MDADSISTKGIVPEAPLFSRIELFVTFADIPMARIPKNRRPIFLIRMFRKMILLIRRNPIQMSRMELLPMTKPPVTVHLMKSCHPRKHSPLSCPLRKHSPQHLSPLLKKFLKRQ